jgi:hypothetical protein
MAKKKTPKGTAKPDASKAAPKADAPPSDSQSMDKQFPLRQDMSGGGDK